ncbi:ornithine cyclodeaminase family protein, partial [Streptomyces sp. NPDC003832]
MTLILTRSDIHGLLADATAEVEAAVADAHRDLALGRADLPAPPVMGVPGSDGAFLAMAAASGPAGLAAVKLLADLPGNAGHGLPVQRSAVLAVSAQTGGVAAVLDGAVLTRVRTAAGGAGAARGRGRPPAPGGGGGGARPPGRAPAR